MSEGLRRGIGVETVAVEALASLDGQGKPAYGAPGSVEARVVREDKVVKLGNGTEVRTTVTLWLDAAQAPLPADEDRVTLADGTAVIVVERADRKGLGGVVDHVRVRARLERP